MNDLPGVTAITHTAAGSPGRRIGSVRAVYRFPIKSLAGESLTTGHADASGITGDRAFAVVDARDGRIASVDSAPDLLYLTARFRAGTAEQTPRRQDLEVLLPSLPEPVAGDAADEALSAWLGRAVQLRDRSEISSHGAAFFDYGFELSAEAPTFGDVPGALHVVTGSSLDWFLAHGGEADARRTRANLVIDLDGPPISDSDLLGQHLRIGGAVIDIVEHTERCRLVEVGQPGLPDRTGLLDALRQERSGNLGVYARVTQAGPVRPGDDVTAAGADT